MKHSGISAAQLWASYQELGSLRAVCRRHKLVSAGSVGVRLRQAGYILHRPGANLSTRRVPLADLRALVEHTGSYAAAAREIGSTPDAVRMRVQRAERARQA